MLNLIEVIKLAKAVIYTKAITDKGTKPGTMRDNNGKFYPKSEPAKPVTNSKIKSAMETDIANLCIIKSK